MEIMLGINQNRQFGLVPENFTLHSFRPTPSMNSRINISIEQNFRHSIDINYTSLHFFSTSFATGARVRFRKTRPNKMDNKKKLNKCEERFVLP